MATTEQVISRRVPVSSLAWALLAPQPPVALGSSYFRISAGRNEVCLSLSLNACTYVSSSLFFFSPFSGLQPQDKSKDLYWF